MDRRNSFTQEELAAAKSVDLTAVASGLGYTVKRIGNYHTLKEMDSIRIYNRRSWFRWSRAYEKGDNGGSQIDFLRVFAGMEVKEAVFWLLDFAGYQRTGSLEAKNLITETPKKEEKKSFVLPEPFKSNDSLYQYLKEVRGLSGEVIHYFLKLDLIYEEKRHHNIVFKGRDKTGVTHFASMRGIWDENGKGFKCDVAGNDKSYGFNVWNDSSTELAVFEGVIDLMSYVDIYNDFHSNKIALGMLADAPLETFLKEHPQIQSIKFCLDNDKPGRTAAEKLMQKYYEAGYEVEDCPPPKGCKDYNLFLQKIKELSTSREGKENNTLKR